MGVRYVPVILDDSNECLPLHTSLQLARCDHPDSLHVECRALPPSTHPFLPRHYDPPSFPSIPPSTSLDAPTQRIDSPRAGHRHRRRRRLPLLSIDACPTASPPSTSPSPQAVLSHIDSGRGRLRCRRRPSTSPVAVVHLRCWQRARSPISSICHPSSPIFNVVGEVFRARASEGEGWEVLSSLRRRDIWKAGENDVVSTATFTILVAVVTRRPSIPEGLPALESTFLTRRHRRCQHRKNGREEEDSPT